MAWRQTVGGTRRLWAARFVSGASWSAPTVVETGTGNASQAQVAIDTRGRGIAVWNVFPPFDGQDAELRASVFDPAVGWAVPETIDVGVRPSSHALPPRIVMAPGGDAMVVREEVTLSEDRGQVWAIGRGAGSEWEAPTQIAETGGTIRGAASQPALAVDAIGNVTVVWVQYTGVIPGLWSNRYEVARGWVGALRLDTREQPVASPRLDSTPRGDTFVVWLQGGNVNDASPPTDVWARRFLPGAGWGETWNVDARADPVHDADIAVDDAGNAIAVWTQGAFPQESAWANRFTATRD